MTDRHILKVQYAEGFRAPTFFELYATGVANAALSFEVNKTAELNYVYRNVGTAARATFFYSKLVDMIFVNNSPQGPQFGNFREGRADGFELEWEREVTRAVKASATLSWVDAKDNRNAGPPPSFAFVTQTPPVTVNWLGNIALLVRAAPHTLVGARWNWVGERNTGRDNRGTQLVDLTGTQTDCFLPGGQPADQHEVEHHADAVDVGALAVLEPHHALRREVRGGSDDAVRRVGARLLRALDELRDAEVEELHRLAPRRAVEEDVVELDVAVDEAGGVGLREDVADRDEELDAAPERHP